MENIAYTIHPPVQPSLQEWMAEFRVGIMVPKKNYQAQEIMKTWTVDNKQVDWKKFIKNVPLGT